MILAQIINESTNKVLSKPILQHAIREGDEIRLWDDRYYTVTKVVWCLDEHHSADVQRVNIGVKEAQP